MHFYHRSLIVKIQQDGIELMTRPALTQLVESTGSVVTPYSRYPNLLETLLGFLKTEQQSTIRSQTLRLLGLLGALDPYKYKQNTGQVIWLHSKINIVLLLHFSYISCMSLILGKHYLHVLDFRRKFPEFFLHFLHFSYISSNLGKNFLHVLNFRKTFPAFFQNFLHFSCSLADWLWIFWWWHWPVSPSDPCHHWRFWDGA